MKKALLLLLVCIWGVNLFARKETCFDMIFTTPRLGTFEDLALIPGRILTITGYTTFSMGPTSAIFSDCSAIEGALNKSDVAIIAFGCGNSREAFFEETNKNHPKIFRKKNTDCLTPCASTAC